MELLLTVWTELEPDIRDPDRPSMSMARGTTLAHHATAVPHAVSNVLGIETETETENESGNVTGTATEVVDQILTRDAFRSGTRTHAMLATHVKAGVRDCLTMTMTALPHALQPRHYSMTIENEATIGIDL